jgi:hypothetical protein
VRILPVPAETWVQIALLVPSFVAALLWAAPIREALDLLNGDLDLIDALLNAPEEASMLVGLNHDFFLR